MPNFQSTPSLQRTSFPDHTTNAVHTQLPSLNDTCRVVFTRQLWQRTMPDENRGEQDIVDKSHITASQGRRYRTSASSGRTSSPISLRFRNRSPSPSSGSDTPFTPEDSPPFQSTRKRSAETAEEQGRPLNSAETSPAHT